jgi:hypothetical protein
MLMLDLQMVAFHAMSLAAAADKIASVRTLSSTSGAPEL